VKRGEKSLILELYMKRMFFVLLVAGLALSFSTTATAVMVSVHTDDFSESDPLTNGWQVDRYAPNGVAGNTAEPFGGTYFQTLFGRSDYLLMGIHPDDASANRLPGYASSFYNTQGIKKDVSGFGIGDTWEMQIDVFLPPASAANTIYRTDFWGRDSNPSEAAAKYPILGYTNDGGFRFRVWDNDNGGWIDLDPILNNFDMFQSDWNTLLIRGTGMGFEYEINGDLAYSDLTGSGLGFAPLQDVYIQAYNFGENANPYIVGYSRMSIRTELQESNAVPEPATAGLALISLLVLVGRQGFARRRVA